MSPRSRPTDGAAGHRLLPLLLLELALAPPLAFIAAEAYLFDGDWQFPLDDSWIHLVFARSLAHGEVLAFNPRELVAGTTAPLWTALVGLLAALPGSIFLWAKLAGIAAQAGSVLLVYSVARRLARSPARAAIAAGLVAASDWLVWSALSGMEIGRACESTAPAPGSLEVGGRAPGGSATGGRANAGRPSRGAADGRNAGVVLSSAINHTRKRKLAKRCQPRATCQRSKSGHCCVFRFVSLHARSLFGLRRPLSASLATHPRPPGRRRERSPDVARSPKFA